jgi:DNA-binding IclR family transcriptional regulator
MSGDLVATVGIVAPIQRLSPADVPALAPAVLRAAADSSRRLGHIVGW